MNSAPAVERRRGLMTKQEQANLIELARSFQARSDEADRKYNERDRAEFSRAFHDGQRHAFGRAAADFWDVLGVEP